MSAPRYEPQQQSAQYRYATVQAVSDGLCDLDFGDPEGEIVTGVPVHGTVPDAGDRVMVLLQGRGATVLPAPATERYVDKAEVFRVYVANPTIPSSWWTPTGGTYDSSTPFVTWDGGAWVVSIQQPGMYAMTLMTSRLTPTLTAAATIHAAVNDLTGNALTWRNIAANQVGDSPFATMSTTLYSPGANRGYRAYFKSSAAVSMSYVIFELIYLGARD